MTAMTPFLLVLLLLTTVVFIGAGASTTAAAASTNNSSISSSSSSKATFSVPLPVQWLPSIIDLKQQQQQQKHDDNNELSSSFAWKDVVSCCQPVVVESANDDKGDDDDDGCVTDSDSDSGGNDRVCVTKTTRRVMKNVVTTYKQLTIGKLPQFTKQQTLEVLEQHALEAWDGGAGVWTSKYTLKQRCDAINNFFKELKKQRELIVQTLMYEIGKNRADAESEFDRTVQFAMELVRTVQTNPEFSSDAPTVVGSTRAYIRRGAIGIILALAPYNYPLNECYATIIPALLMGNVVVLKVPTVGGMVHMLTMDAFRKALPPGVMNFVSGKGRNTMPILMETGRIDGLAFIGGSKAADSLIKSHPHPHRLKVFLQLEANNMAIYLTDLFNNNDDKEPLHNALQQAVLGSLSFNGQRCTALKLHFVPKQYAPKFVQELVQRVEALPVGLPDEKHNNDNGSSYSTITPLPAGANRVVYMKELIDDAVKKGAKIMNKNGGTLVGGGADEEDESTLMVPAVLFPVCPRMLIYHEEQFGPIVPIVEYADINEVLEYGRVNPYGQQVSIFGYDSNYVSTIIDRFSNVFGRINLNVQCGRSPDTMPFSGRRSSALGVMSVVDSLREFSIPTVIAYKQDDSSSKKEQLANEVRMKSNFLQPVV